MLGGNNSNPAIPMFLDENNLQFSANASNQLQLFGNLPIGFNVDPVNYFGNENSTPPLRANKRSRETETISRQQKLQISLNHNVCHDEADRPANLLSQNNPVSTGLRLSYDDDEHNSSITSAGGSITTPSNVILTLGDNLKNELERQKEELDQYIKTQEEHLAKGLRDIRQRHMASFLNAIEKGVDKKLREKDIELENINRKNRELVERMKQIASEAQSWCHKAKYNESVVNILKNNLQQAMHGADQVKEGFGDSEVDEATSGVDANNHHNLSIPGASGKSSVTTGMFCRACRVNTASMLLMPCRHLCLCKDCDVFINVCPVCQLIKSASVPVYLS